VSAGDWERRRRHTAEADAAQSTRLERSAARELQAIASELDARTTVRRQELELEAMRLRQELELDSLRADLDAARTLVAAWEVAGERAGFKMCDGAESEAHVESESDSSEDSSQEPESVPSRPVYSESESDTPSEESDVDSE
jgi:hypothetical protein